MMNEDEIIKGVEKIVNYYEIWTIGITDDPDRRKKEHGDPKNWHQWEADTEEIARNVEKHFIVKGMQGASGGGDTPNFVYIFL